MKRSLVVAAVLAMVIPWSLARQHASPGQVSQAPPAIHTVDPVHSSVWFRINHLGVANFYGRFNKVAGSFVLDDRDMAACRIEVTVQAASVDTNDTKRDQHVCSEELFNAERFPEITFRSKTFNAMADNKFTVEGEMTLHGVTRPLTITLERTGAAKDPWGSFRTGVETTFTVKRSEFGMAGLVGALGDEVRLTVALEGIRQ